MDKKINLADEKLREEIENFILTMLGAPLVKIELTKEMLTLCVSRTCDYMGMSSKVAEMEPTLKLLVAQEGALAHAKLILGRVRAKYGGLSDAKGVKTKSKSTCTFPFGPMDGFSLINDGEREYQSWRQMVFEEGKKINRD